MANRLSRDELLALVESRGMTGRDAETAVELYLAGKTDGPDAGRVTRIVEAFGGRRGVEPCHDCDSRVRNGIACTGCSDQEATDG